MRNTTKIMFDFPGRAHRHIDLLEASGLTWLQVQLLPELNSQLAVWVPRLHKVVATALTGMIAVITVTFSLFAVPEMILAESHVATVTPSAIHLDVSSNSPGGVALAHLYFSSGEVVKGFDLLVQLAQNGPLTATCVKTATDTCADFIRDASFFPIRTMEGHELNLVRNAGPGRIRIVGLAPKAASGTGTVGRLSLHIAADAPVGATYPVTLTGQVNTADQGIVAIEPVVAKLVIGASEPTPNSKSVYLPLIVGKTQDTP